MKFAKLLWLVNLSAIVLSACNIGTTPAPTQDTGMIQTQAMELVSTQFAMQQTQTALAVPPSPLPSITPLATATPGGIPTVSPIGSSIVTTPGVGTPFAFNTPSAGFTPLASAIPTVPTVAAPACNSSTFVEDVNYPDGTEVHPGADFTKIWRIQNSGTCTWDDGYVLVYQGGVFDGYDIKIDRPQEFVEPGEIYKFEVNLTAPLKEGEQTDCWKMRDDGGFYFGTYICVTILVD